MKKILVTGGAGYIGSSLVTALVNNNYEVTVIDILNYNKESLNHLYKFKNFKFYKEDAKSRKKYKKINQGKDFIIPCSTSWAPLCEKNKRLASITNVNSIKLILKHIKKKQKLIYPLQTLAMELEIKTNYAMKNLN